MKPFSAVTVSDSQGQTPIANWVKVWSVLLGDATESYTGMNDAGSELSASRSSSDSAARSTLTG